MVQFELTEEQVRFGEMVARFMADKSTPAAVRAAMDSELGHDPAVWRQLCSELALAGTHIPEAYGGFGFGPVELGIAAEEMGRRLYCGPFLASSVMAAYAILEAATEPDRERLLPGIATGETLAALVIDSLDTPQKVGRELTAREAAGAWNVSGRAGMVIDAHNASVLVVVAQAPSGLGLFVVSPDDERIAIDLRESVDATRKLCSVTFSDTPAEPIGQLDARSLAMLWDRLSVFLAHEMIGGAQALLDSTVEYTKVRYQFGRPIGSFQALKHRCADLLMELELAKASTRHASWCLATDDRQGHEASMAKAMASDAYVNIAIAAIQLRGGIGFTWEDDTHLWFKRAKGSEVLFGSPHFHRERMLTAIEERASD